MKKGFFCIINCVIVILICNSFALEAKAATYGDGDVVSYNTITEEDILMSGCVIKGDITYRQVANRESTTVVDGRNGLLNDNQFLKIGQQELFISGSPIYYGIYSDAAIFYKAFLYFQEYFPGYGSYTLCVYPVYSLPVEPDNGLYIPIHTHDFVTGVIYDATCNNDGLEGTYCKTCGFIKESSPISAFGFTLEKYAQEKMDAAKSGQTIVLEFGTLNSFPKTFMEKIAAKVASGVTFEFRYKWNNKLQKITIPAGSVVDTTLDWYGPATMEQLYGAN